MEHRIPAVYRISAAIAVFILAGMTAGTIALRIWFPPAKIRGLIVEQVSLRLHREVRLKRVDLSVVRGLVVEGLEISEKPDFKAGVFAGVESLRLRILWLPLLRRQVVIDEIMLSRPSLSLVRLKPGVFNFSDLLAAPDKTSPGASSPGTSLPFDLQAGKIMLEGGRIAYEDHAAGVQWRLTQMRVLATQMSLLRPFALEAGLQAEELAPGALKVRVDLAAQADLSGMASGKFSVDIKKFSANLAGLALNLSGPVRLDKERLDVPDLKGQLGDGTIALKASIEDYARSPRARLDATLSSLDLERLMEVNAALGRAPASSQGKASACPVEASVAVPMKTSGQVAIGKLRYRGISVESVALAWDLKGLTPDMRGLSGWAKLSSGPGLFVPEPKAEGLWAPLKVLLAPLAVLKFVPSMNKLLVKTVTGDYSVDRGMVTVRDFHIDGDMIDMRAVGTIDLSAQKLNLRATIAIARAAPISADIGGTFDAPRVRVNLSQVVSKSLEKLAAPAAELLKGFFRKK